jgi:phosphatidylserine/phosphatidylglycerophosphate/cardiolipin synthase-like enzyme
VGSTNFSFRGIYIQSNNVLVFEDPDVAGLFGRVFDAAFDNPDGFATDELAAKWHTLEGQGRPPLHFCFSPHGSSDISLNPVRGAIEQASSSVLYAVALLSQNQVGPHGGGVQAPDEAAGLQLRNHRQARATPAAEARRQRRAGRLQLPRRQRARAVQERVERRQGINVHHKFVITDFGLPTAKVFTGSSNLAPSGEQGNGDHLILIEDRKVAVAYAIEAIRLFDHLHFRDRMKAAGMRPRGGKPKGDLLKLRKPRAISGKPPPGSRVLRERLAEGARPPALRPLGETIPADCIRGC